MAKRKSLVIYQENNPPIQITDDDEKSLTEYAKSLSEFMSLSNISILETSNSAVIIRPSKIASIFVDECDFSEDEEDKKPEKDTKPKTKVVRKKPITKKPKKEEPVDIITDVDA
jgi:hypothetical protein